MSAPMPVGSNARSKHTIAIARSNQTGSGWACDSNPPISPFYRRIHLLVYSTDAREPLESTCTQLTVALLGLFHGRTRSEDYEN